MKTITSALIAALAGGFLTSGHTSPDWIRTRVPAPLADHHQHFFSPTLLEWARSWNPAAQRLPTVTAKELVSLLDSAGIRHAVVLSVAYQYGNPAHPAGDEYERVKAENDWTSRQVALYPDRLRGFCGVNPLRDYALQEIARCANDPNLRAGSSFILETLTSTSAIRSNWRNFVACSGRPTPIACLSSYTRTRT
jgi:hypothetical protein